MQISWIDWGIVILYIIFAMGVGVWFARRASSSLSEFFISGRNLPWWIAGTSMVATTFAADTPLAITGMVAHEGIAGNWLWWNMAATHVMATFFFARLWRRADIITDLELISLRYSGKPAQVLRGFRSFWEGIVLNCIIMGWVILAMVKIMDVLFGLDQVAQNLGLPGWIDGKWLGIVICLIIAVAYTFLSGFWGVVMTDFIQFFLAMFGAVALAVISLNEFGGIGEVKMRLAEQFSGRSGDILNFFPEVGGSFLPMVTFVAFLSVNWWATKAADGGGYIAQRMFSAKNEKHSFFATLWYTIAHYAIRPWPWIIVGLISLIAFPDLEDKEAGYPMMVLTYMPVGMLGIMLASFLAAFMSTIDTQINWGTSVLINDLYKPFLKPGAQERHYITASRWLIVLLMVLGGGTAYLMQSIKGAWQLMYGMTAGIGGVYIMRWFWWRVNAWSEITAWLVSAVVYYLCYLYDPKMLYGWKLIITTLCSTSAWVAVTLLTAPTEESRLVRFYERIRPGSPWWKPIAAKSSVRVDSLGWYDIGDWFAGIFLVYSSLFFIGKLIFQEWISAGVYLVIAVVSAYIIYRNFDRHIEKRL